MSHEGHGNHWQCLLKDTEQIFRLLPVMLKYGRPVDNRSQATPLEDTTIGVAWPDTPLCALSLISVPGEKSGKPHAEIKSVFPYVAQGVRRRLVVEEIIPWQNGIEAWIKASLPGEAGPVLRFFDTRFYANCGLVKVGEEAEFVLAGLAYFAEVVRPEPVLITKPETIRAMRALTKSDDDLSPIEVRMEGAAMLFPRDDYAPDEYEFHGPVKRVEAFEVFDARITKLTLTVSRLIDADDSDIDIELFVSNHVWRTDERPLPGVDVRGLLWLQGCLAG